MDDQQRARVLESLCVVLAEYCNTWSDKKLPLLYSTFSSLFPIRLKLMGRERFAKGEPLNPVLSDYRKQGLHAALATIAAYLDYKHSLLSDSELQEIYSIGNKEYFAVTARLLYDVHIELNKERETNGETNVPDISFSDSNPRTGSCSGNPSP